MKLATLMLLAGLAGCTGYTVNSHVDVCCPQASYETFSVVPDEIPAFLGPMIVSNFAVALAARGLQPVEAGGDLQVTLRFEKDDLTTAQDNTGFDESLSPGGDVRFVARIVIEMREARSRALIFSGAIHHLHDVGPGEVMHTGRASIAMFEAFGRVLADFPAKEPGYER